MAGAVNHIDGVREQPCDSVKRLDCTTRAARKIDNDGFRANAYNPAREQRTLREFSAFRAHVLGKSGYQAFDRRLRSLRRDVAGANARTAGRQN